MRLRQQTPRLFISPRLQKTGRWILFFIICISFSHTASALIIDHTCTSINQIPDSYIALAQKDLRIFYGTASHGTQLVEGMSLIEQDNTKYSFAFDWSLPTENNAVCMLYQSQSPDVFFGSAQSYLDANPTINVAMFSWCGEAYWYDPNTYFAQMGALEAANPTVKFVYMTGHAQEDGCSGCLRHLFNETVRAYCETNNKILYDFADLDSWYGGVENTYLLDGDCGCAGMNIQLQHPQYFAQEAYHTTYESCINKGRAAWWMLAKLAGWQNTNSMTCNFPQAGWSMISSHVIPTEPDVSTLLESSLSHLVIMKNGAGQVYWPNFGIDMIGNWNIEHGYLLYVNAPDTLIIQGASIVPEAMPIALSAGWNMISYLRDSPLATADALAGISSYLTIAKNGAGNVYLPAYGINTIGNMQPGEGYWVYVDHACTLTYPANDVLPKVQGLAADRLPGPAHYASYRTNTGNNATLLISAAYLPDGTEIGAWTDRNLLIGSGVVHQGRALLTLWGDDIMTQGMDGALAGEPLALTGWQPDQHTEVPLQCTSLKDGLIQMAQLPALEYHSNAIWLVETAPAANLPDEFDLMQNYPNPFNPSTAIRYQLPLETRVALMVYTLSGTKVRTLVDGIEPAGFHEVLWNGRDNGDRLVPSGIYWVKMKAGDDRKAFKMTLIK